VDFYGAFYVDGTLSFILEFMDKGTFSDLLSLKGKFPEPVLGRLSLDILRGLEYLHHTLHLIHRDIKPQNILVNTQGVVKLADFGVSGEIANTAAFANTFIGTIKYMSVNRIKGSKYSAKSDIWSLGLVILECATGQFPYGETGIYYAFLQMVLSSEPPRAPSEGQFSEEFKNFICLCLQKEEENLPFCTTLLNHPWIQMNQNIPFIDWLNS